MRVLVGDVGGTKTNLALAERTGERVTLHAVRRCNSGDWSSLEHCARWYLDETGQTCERAAFAVAGPVHGDRCETTNLAWVIEARVLELALGCERVVLLNDLEAVAWAIGALEPAQIEELHPGEAGSGNACVIAAGTGLGEAGLFWDGRRHHPFASEGGHADFAPVSEIEIALHEFMRREHGRVSWERVVSGMGVGPIHAFLRERHGASEPAWLREAIEHGQVAAVIAEAARRGDDGICIETMDLLFGLLGREASNLALKHMALGGIYLTGGVVQRNVDLLRRSPFLQRAFDKGRMSGLVRRMPVRVILDEHAALIGAARCADQR
jgi:glucokinase